MPDRRGYTLVELLVVAAIVAVLVGLTAAAVQKVRAAAARSQCANQMRQLALALHGHHAAAGSLPPGVRTHNDPHPYLSWLVRVSPHFEQGDRWRQAQADYAVNRVFVSPPPHAGLAAVVPGLICPTVDRRVGTTDDGVTAAFTTYLGVSGGEYTARDGVLFPNSKVRLADITDGTANTLLLGERPPSADLHFGWWYAGQGQTFDAAADFLLPAVESNRTFRAPTCPSGPHRFGPGRDDELCDLFHFWSHHPGGANFAFADGAVRFLRYEAADRLPALATRAGGETAPVD